MALLLDLSEQHEQVLRTNTHLADVDDLKERVAHIASRELDSRSA